MSRSTTPASRSAPGARSRSAMPSPAPIASRSSASLGWEIYVPVDMARHVFDTLIARGADVGLRLCGTQALNSCRLEKAYRDCGHDMASTDHVLEAGLGFAVKLDKAKGRFGDFHRPRGRAEEKAGRPVAPPRAISARRSAPAALRQRGDPARRPRRGLSDVGRLWASSRRRRRPRLCRLQPRRKRRGAARLDLRYRGGRRAGRRAGQPRAALRSQGRTPAHA